VFHISNARSIGLHKQFTSPFRNTQHLARVRSLRLCQTTFHSCSEATCGTQHSSFVFVALLQFAQALSVVVVSHAGPNVNLGNSLAHVDARADAIHLGSYINLTATLSHLQRAFYSPPTLHPATHP
jgi:hypothetical protein